MCKLVSYKEYPLKLSKSIAHVFLCLVTYDKGMNSFQFQFLGVIRQAFEWSKTKFDKKHTQQ